MLNKINYDILLEYLSAQKYGSWNQFKNSLSNLDYNNELDYYDYNAVQKMFTRLGHLEFDFDKRTYAVVHPTLLVNPNSEYGILCGYRNKDFINSIKEKYEVLEENNVDAPKLIKVKYLNKSNFQSDFPNVLISENFSMESLYLCDKFYNIENFYNETLKNKQDNYFFLRNNPLCKYYDINRLHSFINIKHINTQIGLYELSNYSHNKYYLIENDLCYNIQNNDKQMGIFLIHYILKKKNLIQYSPEKKTLYIPIYIYFPKLIDKCLTSLTGKNSIIVQNKYNIKLRKYENIDSMYATAVAKILQQDSKVI